MALAFLQQAPAGLVNLWSSPSIPSQAIFPLERPLPIPPSCPNAQVSCQNSSSVEDLCCFNAPGGQFLLTQFWDTHPATGPRDSWTAHGIWPDKCDGSFEQFCDSKRHYSNISAILSSSGRDDLLKDMHTYWKDFKGRDEHLWNHEWNKHGTCVSTLSPHCYKNYSPQTEVVDYFSAAMRMFHSLPTYNWLSAAGITPDPAARFSLRQISDVLESRHGYPVTLRCRYGQLDEVWYHFDVRGSIQTGDFIPTFPDGPKGNCPAEGIRYMPKIPRARPGPGDPTRPPRPVPTDKTPFKGRGMLNIKPRSEKREKGCVISSGQWYTSGTCATLLAVQQVQNQVESQGTPLNESDEMDDSITLHVEEQGITLRSRKGLCAVLDKSGALKCAASIRTASVFGYQLADDGEAKLSYRGKTRFWAEKVPRGFKKGTIFVDQGDRGTELEIVWAPIPI